MKRQSNWLRKGRMFRLGVDVVEQYVVVEQIDGALTLAQRELEQRLLRLDGQRFARDVDGPINLRVGVNLRRQHLEAAGDGGEYVERPARVLQMDARAERILFVLPQLERLLCDHVAGLEIGDA